MQEEHLLKLSIFLILVCLLNEPSRDSMSLKIRLLILFILMYISHGQYRIKIIMIKILYQH